MLVSKKTSNSGFIMAAVLFPILWSAISGWWYFNTFIAENGASAGL